MAASTVIGDVIGRDRELVALGELLSGGDRAPSVMVLEVVPSTEIVRVLLVLVNTVEAAKELVPWMTACSAACVKETW